MSCVEEECESNKYLEKEEELTNDNPLTIASGIPIVHESSKKLTNGSFISDVQKRGIGVKDCNRNLDNVLHISHSSKNCDQNDLNKLEDNSTLIKSEKRRTFSLTRNAPPPLIHYLQDKETPETDDDNSPPRLLPEVIVTRTKLHKEKSQAHQDENLFKISVQKNMQKIKRRTWMKFSNNSSLSDDQTSNESHEHISSYVDTSQCSLVASGLLKKGVATCSEKTKRFKSSIHCEKSLGMSISGISSFQVNSDSTSLAANEVESEFSSGTGSFNSNAHLLDRNVENKAATSEYDAVENLERETCGDLRNDVEFEHWMTETEDEEEDDDIFVTPSRISTGKEERDTIDGIEFLGFETERDMVEYTKIEIDFQGNAQCGSFTHSDDGLDMMDDSYHCSESEAQTSFPIIPTKTKDITKIKGWRTKNFAVNNNPSDGQGSSSSVGAYDDDDGFVSCDIKMEEDASLDMEEQGDLWNGGEPDLFVHDNHFPIGEYPEESSRRESSQTEKIMESNTLFSNFEDKNREKNVNKNVDDEQFGTGRYPKRHSANLLKKEELLIKQSSPVPDKIPKKRGRKPKTLAEKRLMLQMANQYKQKRKRGRPKGSFKKNNNKFFKNRESSVSDIVYNLRKKTKKEDDLVKTSVTDTDDITRKQKYFSALKEKEENGNLNLNVSSMNSEKNEGISSLLSHIPCKRITTDATVTYTTVSIRTTTTDTLTTSIATSLPRPITTGSVSHSPKYSSFSSILSTSRPSSELNLQSHNTSSLANFCSSTTFSVATATATKTTTAVTTVVSNSYEKTTSSKKYDGINNLKQIHACENMVSLVDTSDKFFEYGLILSTGVRKPLVALALEQLNTLRKNNCHIDEHWARFATSVVVSRDSLKTALPSNTIILPVRARSLPFMSCTPKTSLDVPSSSLWAPTRLPRPQPVMPKFDPLIGASVRVRCPRPLTQVGVRTIPSIFKRQRIENEKHILETKMQWKSQVFGEDFSEATLRLLSEKNHSKCEIDEQVKKVVEDLVDYVERREAKVVVHEEPRFHSFNCYSSSFNENMTKKKKGPMIRELSRLDVNVIEMWDARNKKCTEEHCKLGCICESLQCGKPSFEEHCGKEECMFNCVCTPKREKNGDKPPTLLSPLTLLTIPQQNRKLAKEEKEFQQTVIRAKHETIVVSSSGSSRRKREIKLPGRYRDSYVALGKDYGLIDFKISSDENLDPSTRRLTKISPVSHRELIHSINPKNNIEVSKRPWEVKLSELKLLYGIKECSIKLFKSNCVLPTAEEKEMQDLSPAKPSEEDTFEVNLQRSEGKSRNVAVKSTTLPPNIWYDPRYFAARTAPINSKLLKKYKKQNSCDVQVSESEKVESIYDSSKTVIAASNNQCPEHSVSQLSSNLVLDDSPESFGKIECVTTLSEEQFQKGDLSFGIQPFQTESSTSNVEAVKTVLSTDKNVKNKVSNSISFDKIANLLNRKIRELKETGGNVSFPSGNEESIHLLQWPVLKDLFQSKQIQLWYYNGGSKLVITSTKIKPDSSYVNLHDITEQQHKQLPPIISDLLKSDGKKSKNFYRDIYALLHFDGKHVELVGTIFKNRSSSEQSNASTPKNIKLLSDSYSEINKDRPCLRAIERPVVNVTSQLHSVVPKSGELKSTKINFTNFKAPEKEKHLSTMKSSINNCNSQSLSNKIVHETDIASSVTISPNISVKTSSISKNSTDKERSSAIKLPNVHETNSKNDTEEKSTSLTKIININIISQELGHKNQSEKEFPSAIKKSGNVSINTHNHMSRNFAAKDISPSEFPHVKIDSLDINSRSHTEKVNSQSTRQPLIVDISSDHLINENETNEEFQTAITATSLNLNSQTFNNTTNIEKEKCFKTVTKLSDSQNTMKQIEIDREKLQSSVTLTKIDSVSHSVTKTKNSLTNQVQTSIINCDSSSKTRVKKLKMVWQSTKVRTAKGENLPIPLPSCAVDSRWFVLSLNTPFDMLHITSKNCSAKQKHIFETVRMASSHGKTVRLPLQVSSKDCSGEDPNQPKFGVYAVPNISSFVFLGPYGLNDDAGITKSIISNGKYVNINDKDDYDRLQNKDIEEITEQEDSVINILTSLCDLSDVEEHGNNKSWLFTKSNSDNESRDSSQQTQMMKPKENLVPTSSYNSQSGNSRNLKNSSKCQSTKEMKHLKKDQRKEKVEIHNQSDVSSTEMQDTSMNSSSQLTNEVDFESIQKTILSKSGIEVSSNQQFPNNKLPKQPSSTNENTSKRTIDETHSEVTKKLVDIPDLSNITPESPLLAKATTSIHSSLLSKSLASKKKVHVSHSSNPKRELLLKKSKLSKKSNLQKLQKQTDKQSSILGWLVPSFSWIGCVPCSYEPGGEIRFSHPVSGLKMMFSNLESTQLWLDRLFQSAILYVPRQLFVTWSLRDEMERDRLLSFDSKILNGNYMMTMKGIFDIDKLVASEAENYGLKPIEVLRLQDKKCRRDLELGLYQLQRALGDTGYTPYSSKVELMEKAVKEIETLKQTCWELDSEKKKLKNTKHHGLLKLFNIMKGLPVDKKRGIIEKLKTQLETKSGLSVSSKDIKDLNDGLTFSMARYCGNSSLFARKVDESDLEDYLSSEYDEEVEDSTDNAVSDRNETNLNLPQMVPEIKNNSETTEESSKILNNNKIDSKTTDDDESVSISLVTSFSSSQDQNEEKIVENSDDITVICLNDFNGSKNSVCNPISKQNEIPSNLDSTSFRKEKVEKSSPGVLKSPPITLKPIGVCSPMKTITTLDVKSVVPYAVAVKRKITEANYPCIAEELPKKMKTLLASESNQSHLELGMKKCKTIKIDSSLTIDKDSPTNKTTAVSGNETTQSNSVSPMKSSAGPVFLNLVSGNQSKIIPFHVDDQIKDQVQNYGTLNVPTSSSLPNRTLKIIHKEVKPLLMKGSHGAVLMTNHSMSSIVQTPSGVLGSTNIPSSLPVLSLKKVSKDSIPPGIEPRLATFLPPPLVPISDKKQALSFNDKSTQALTPLTPLPTLIKMVDGKPAEKGNSLQN